MKQKLEDYFIRKYARWRKYKNSFPMISWDEDVPSFMYVGEINNENYVQWKAIPKDEIYDFSEVKNEYNIELHPDIKEYFNSYWFLELTGRYEDYSVILEPVVPGIGLRDFYRNLKEHHHSHGNQLKYIPIGFEADGLIILVDNETGKVFIEDHESQTYEKIAENLVDLIEKM
ncbi:SecY-interacting protein Syd [Paenibacillus xylanexedens]|uniref:SecY-interacting protein Syd n=1 Tax=Paenibacillus xylanexedens TaxID=528191 RepID=UPI0011AA10E5|nr:SecY-interacting protein Syd [Paenibacillus xylanexedens]